jgi:hypothetical protein
MPQISSSRLIPWLTAERVTPRRSAAALKFPSSATARKTGRRFRSIVIVKFR